ncbi:MAG: hypothetical protein IJU50_08270 [Lachnospiraceae bacterium]|nr:hypothetical protein [Lachnospiraceae bacterium]
MALTAAELPNDAMVRNVREKLNMNSNEFSTYNDILEKSGVFSSKTAYGRIRFALPYLKEYICSKAAVDAF